MNSVQDMEMISFILFVFFQASGNQRHITMPDGNRRDHFLKWIEDLSDRQTPSWLGLPNNAEKVTLTKHH